MKKAIVSVYNKAGIVEFVRNLKELGWEIVSTGGTARSLRDAGIEVTNLSDVTGFPEIMDGRVKTLHPKIHGGILARRDVEKDMETVRNLSIPLFDMVVVNLYPFREVVEKGGSFSDIIENIDIGGPTLIRAAAKNFKDVIVVVDPSDYGFVIASLKKGGLSLEERFYLAKKAFYHTATYDAYISNYFHRIEADGSVKEDIPSKMILEVGEGVKLRYGENPHQRGFFFGPPITDFLIQGKELSYNNILDADGAYRAVLEFEDPAVVIVKHTNPCGVCESKDLPLKEIFVRARECDPVSAFGGIIAVNREVDGELAEEISRDFYEVLIAPSISEDARRILSKKKDLRVLEMKGYPLGSDMVIRSAMGGYLIQDQDVGNVYNKLEVVTEVKPDDRDIEELIFGMKVVKHVKSNAIVITKDKTLLGVGAGQMSRVDSVRIAINKSRFSTEGAYLASDAFFPFPDSIEEAKNAGIKGIIQPGGSLRDKEVIEACNKYGIFMIFTGMRHFRH